jgi:hypothetical protein
MKSLKSSFFYMLNVVESSFLVLFHGPTPPIFGSSGWTFPVEAATGDPDPLCPGPSVRGLGTSKNGV